MFSSSTNPKTVATKLNQLDDSIAAKPNGSNADSNFSLHYNQDSDGSLDLNTAPVYKINLNYEDEYYSAEDIIENSSKIYLISPSMQEQYALENFEISVYHDKDNSTITSTYLSKGRAEVSLQDFPIVESSIKLSSVQVLMQDTTLRGSITNLCNT